MSEPVEWLRRVIEGDMALAKDTLTPGSGISPEWNEPSSGVLITGDGTDLDGLWSLGDSRLSRHIATHDPRDVIARCEAELAILDEHIPWPEGDEKPECRRCGYWDLPSGSEVYWPCRTVRLLAWGYRHRDGYAEVVGDWKP